MQEINKEIMDVYGLDIKSIIPFKDSYIIHCDKGRKILKKTDLTPERINFIHEAKEHLIRNNFTNLDRYICTLDGDPFFVSGDVRYVITEAVDGRECNFDSRADVVKASNILACMHKASRGLVVSEKSKPKDELGKLPGYFIKRLEEIKKLKKIAKKGKTKFDFLFLEHIDYYYDLGLKAIEALSSSKYEVLVETARREGILCHHDYTHSNILCNENGVWVINYDFCCFELKIYDIANLIRRKMRKCSWDINEAKTIIYEYGKIEDLSRDEFDVMRIILQFPQKFWRVTNKYYNSRKSWSEKSYVSKLQEVIEEIEPHKNFMDRYDELM